MRNLLLFAVLYLMIGYFLSRDNATFTCDPKAVPDAPGPVIDPCAQVVRTISLKQILLAPINYLSSWLSSFTNSISSK